MSFFAELKRRNVFKVGVAYAIVAWLLVQITSIVAPALHLPNWTLTLIIYLTIIGFPLALFLAWAFELTPEGIKPTSDVDKAQSITRATGQKLNHIIITLLSLAVIFLVIDNYVLSHEELPSVATGPGETKAKAGTEPAEAVNRKSIAVLPFADRSNTKADSYFVDGIQDDILTQLAKITSLKVISRTSVMGYRNTTKNMKTIGRELGVATVLEGGVQRAGNRVRINVQLIDADKDEHLWAETYNRKLTAENIFTIQSEISKAIASALRAALSPEEEAKLNAVPTKNLEALEAYFKGKQHLVARTSKGLEQALGYFQQAVDLDPGFDLAYVGLADTYQLQYNYSGLPKEEMNVKAGAAIDKALSLNDKLGEAYASLGLLKAENNEYSASEQAFEKALALNPNYAAIYNWYGSLKSLQGQYEEALALFRKGVDLDPLSVVLNSNIAIQLVIQGRGDEGLAQIEKVIAISPGSPSGYGLKGSYYYFSLGQLDKAARWLRKAYALDSQNPGMLNTLATMYWDLGDDTQAECWARRDEALAPENYAANAAMLGLYILHGDEKQAVAYARKGLQIEPRPDYPEDIATLRDHDVRTGNYRAARSRYAQYYPELLSDDPGIGPTNYRAAVDLAAVLQKTGEQERANRLLNDVLKYIRGIQRLGYTGYGIRDVEIYALQGNKKQALVALKQAVDNDWRWYWKFKLEHNANIDSIRKEPEFQTMVAEIKMDMAGQLARVRKAEGKDSVCVTP